MHIEYEVRRLSPLPGASGYELMKPDLHSPDSKLHIFEMAVWSTSPSYMNHSAITALFETKII